MLKTKFSQYFQCQKWCLVFLIFDHVLIAFYVLQHGWYIQNNSVAALFNMWQQEDHVEIYVFIKTTGQVR